MEQIGTKSADNSASQKEIRILCFGDSLTAGYMLTSPNRFPYGDTMQTELAKLLSLPLSQVHVDIDGLPGDQVAGGYMRRMKRRLEKAEKNPYDYVIVMGGTNDLGWGQSPNTIYYNLKLVWQKPLDIGANVVALNIIETARSSEGMIKKRADLNDMIASHQQERFHAFDLWSVVRYTSIDEQERSRIWDDGLHLTAAGYDIMGKAVAAHVFKLIQNAGPKPKSEE